MVNTNKLKGKIIEKGYTVDKLASEIGISASTFYRKMAGNQTSFSIEEVSSIIKVLNIKKTESMSIFFNN